MKLWYWQRKLELKGAIWYHNACQSSLLRVQIHKIFNTRPLWFKERIWTLPVNNTFGNSSWMLAEVLIVHVSYILFNPLPLGTFWWSLRYIRDTYFKQYGSISLFLTIIIIYHQVDKCSFSILNHIVYFNLHILSRDKRSKVSRQYEKNKFLEISFIILLK